MLQKAARLETASIVRKVLFVWRREIREHEIVCYDQLLIVKLLDDMTEKNIG